MQTVINKGTGKTIKLDEHKDLLGEGGEGRVFAKNGTVYKVFFDESKMIPVQKIHELQTITSDLVLTPKHILMSTKGNPIGFTTNLVKDYVYMPRLFVTSFWDKNGIKLQNIVDLVTQMQKTIKDEIHPHKILMVDGNEMNYLVDNKTFSKPYFIDVNAWQTPSFPATVIMPSIRDPFAKRFTELSDWYSFAIVTCQLFVGLHPFKGRHPDFSGKDQLTNRMKKNISIFNPNTKVPGAVRDLSIIPKQYKDWYVRMFERGERIEPPWLGKHQYTFEDKAVVVPNQNVRIELLVSLPQTITNHYGCETYDYLQTRDDVYRYAFKEKRLQKYELCSKASYILYDKLDESIAYEVFIKDGSLHISTLGNDEVVNTNHAADELMIHDNCLYVKTSTKFKLMKLVKTKNTTPVVGVDKSWTIDSGAQMFDGMLYSVIGKEHYLYFPLPGGALKTEKTEQLKNTRVLDAKYENGVCMLRTMNSSGEENYVIFMNIAKMDEAQIVATEAPIINFVSLPDTKPIIAILHTDGQLLIMPKNAQSQGKVVEHKNLTTNLRLTRSDFRTGVLTRHKFYRISTKKRK